MDFIASDRFIDLSNIVTTDIDFAKEADQLKKVLDAATKETDIQQYIKSKRKWFIPASILKDYDFGHRSAYLVSEQALGIEYRADYMLLGFNSAGPQIVLVEFENVNVDYKITTSNSETADVRKGLTQILDWKRWMDDNRMYFLNSCGLSEIARSIPSWGIHYCLVVSRRTRMNEVCNQMRRQKQHEVSELRIITYDRLVDNVRELRNGFCWK